MKVATSKIFEPGGNVLLLLQLVESFRVGNSGPILLSFGFE